MTTTEAQFKKQIVNHAGLFRRLAALLYDCFLIGAIWFGITGIAVLLNGGEAMPVWANQFILLPILILSSFVFYFWFWTHGGQTLGMRAWRLRILNEEEQTPNLKQCTLRFFLAFFTFGIGFLYTPFNSSKKSIHDSLSKTQIVLLPKE